VTRAKGGELHLRRGKHKPLKLRQKRNPIQTDNNAEEQVAEVDGGSVLGEERPYAVGEEKGV